MITPYSRLLHTYKVTYMYRKIFTGTHDALWSLLMEDEKEKVFANNLRYKR